MRKSLKFVLMFVLISLLGGCEEEEKTIYLMPEGSPEVVEEVEGLLEKEPEIVGSLPDEKYIVRVIPPEPEIDHKITIIRPDPDIDFKIKIINPSAAELPEDVLKKLAEKIREQLRQEQEKRGK